MKPTAKQAQTIIRQLGTDKANASAEIARLRAALERIESRAVHVSVSLHFSDPAGLRHELRLLGDEARNALHP